jgi:aconitate hydratase
MVNALGVLGWGVGRIEAEGVMFGVPVSLRVPEVIGVRLIGRLQEGTTSTDLALRITELCARWAAPVSSWSSSALASPP